MNKKQLEQIAKTLKMGWVGYHDEVTSTNDLAAAWVSEGAPHFSIIAANHQTEGRGRSGRKWFTPPDSALAFSLLLRPDRSQESMGKFSGLGALAVCSALVQEYQTLAEIKWPNDVLLAGKKVCGVLPEAIWTGNKLEAIILGIGINLTKAAYPKDIPLLYPATSIEEVTGKPVNASQFLLAVLAHLKDWYNRLDTPLFTAKWEQHLAFRGKSVEIIHSEHPAAAGQIIGLDDQGQLILETSPGLRETFSASEIHLRPVVDSGSN